ncbi:MAG: hypothetical protein ABI249_07610 [Ornithinibacter sp.]
MRHHLPRPALALAALVTCASMAACGTSGTRPEVVVTVTGTPSPAAPDAPSSPTPSASPTAQADPVKSDVLGRSFDFGLVKSAKTVGGTDVLVIDRWTDPAVDDAELAKTGLTVAAYDLKKNPYKNVNSTVVFRVPVREGTTFLLNHCVAAGEPLQTMSVDAGALAAAPEADRLVLLTLDDAGYATSGETFASC